MSFMIFDDVKVRKMLKRETTETRRPFRVGRMSKYLNAAGHAYWAREAVKQVGDGFVYRADLDERGDGFMSPYHASIKSARIFFRVTDIRREKLNDISDASVALEGFGSPQEFFTYWDSVSKHDYRYHTNPEVLVLGFEYISSKDYWLDSVYYGPRIKKNT